VSYIKTAHGWTENEYRSKCDDALRLGVKAFVDKRVGGR